MDNDERGFRVALVADYGNTARGGPTWPSEHYWTV